MDQEAVNDLLKAARELLAALWERAMNDDITEEEAQAIQHACVSIAIADRGTERVGPFSDWKSE